MEKVKFCALLPAENPVKLGESLNVLVVTENPGPEVERTVRFFASDGGGFQEIWAESRVLPARSHPHLYFNLPARCFAPDAWGGETPEELTLWVGETEPENGEQGILLFFES